MRNYKLQPFPTEEPNKYCTTVQKMNTLVFIAKACFGVFYCSCVSIPSFSILETVGQDFPESLYEENSRGKSNEWSACIRNVSQQEKETRACWTQLTADDAKY